MVANIKELFNFRELVAVWTMREIKVRYKQSLLGAVWAILQPLSMMIIFTVVFSRWAKVPTDGIPYPIFSYTALLPWTLFSSTITLGVPTLVTNLNLVVKTYFPREVLPIGALGASFFDFLVASTIFVAMMLFYRMSVSWTILWVPFILVIQLLLTLGLTLLGSSILVIYRDVRFLVPLGLQIWLYLTPVIYPATLVPEKFRWLYMLNPMAGIITAYRAVVLYGQNPSFLALGIALVESVLILFLGYLVFKKLELAFADII